MTRPKVQPAAPHPAKNDSATSISAATSDGTAHESTTEGRT